MFRVTTTRLTIASTAVTTLLLACGDISPVEVLTYDPLEQATTSIDYHRILPTASANDGGTCLSTQTWFNYPPCGDWKEFSVRPGHRLHFYTYGDSCGGCVLWSIRYAIQEYRNGAWQTVQEVNPEPDTKGMKHHFYYTPTTNRLRVLRLSDDSWGFYAIVKEAERAAAGAYTLSIDLLDGTFPGSVLEKMVETHFLVYPQMVDRFNPWARTAVRFIIDPAYGGIAGASNGVVTYSSTWLRDRPEDTDVVTHEVMHIAQAYPGGNPGWLVEGIADFARYKYGVNNVNGGWALPAYRSSHDYTDGYGVTARFLLWLELRVRSTIVDDLDAECRARTYDRSTGVDLTGRTVDQLWSSYAKDPSLKASAKHGRNLLFDHNPGNTYHPGQVQLYVPSWLGIYRAVLTGSGHNQDCQKIPRAMEVKVNGTAHRVISYLSFQQTGAFSYTLPRNALASGNNSVSAYIRWGNSSYDCGHWVDVDLDLTTNRCDCLNGRPTVRACNRDYIPRCVTQNSCDCRPGPGIIR